MGMYKGINPEGRNSSKVLRPPGGGSSLGPFTDYNEPEPPKPQKKTENLQKVETESPAVTEDPNTGSESAPPSDPPAATEELPPPPPASTEEAPVTEAPSPPSATEEAAPVTVEDTPAEGGSNDSAAVETPAPAAAPTPSPAPAPAAAPAPTPPVAGVRGRVPPGGHTSGPFW